MGFIKEFREFAVKGNVIDMAVGIIIGAAFGKIVSSLVNDVMMPPLLYLISGVDVKDLKVTLADAVPAVAAVPATATTPEIPAQKAIDAVVIRYGNFLNEIITFTIVAFAVFLLVKFINKLKRKEEAAPPPPAAPPADVVLLTEIRDLLQRQGR